MVRARKRRHISSDADIEVHDTFVRHDGSERRCDGLRAAAHAESMAGSGGDIELQIDLAIRFGESENVSAVSSD